MKRIITKRYSELKKFKNIIIVNSLGAFLVGVIFGFNSILDGYGDVRLVVYYLLLFLLLSLPLSAVTYFLGKIRKSHVSIFDNLFFLSVILLGILILVITNYAIMLIFKSSGSSYFYSFPRNLSFFISIVFILWFSSFRKKTLKYVILIFSSCLILLWEFIFINPNFHLKKTAKSYKDAPNILLLTVESLRYDYLGINGNNRMKTKNIDSLAKKGVIFENYFVQAPYTTSSLTTLMTGFYPFNHGARALGQKPNSESIPFVNEMANEGYSVYIDGFCYPILFPNYSQFDIRHIKITNKSSFIKYFFSRIAEIQYIANDMFGNCIPFLFGRYCFGNSTSMRQTSILLRNIRTNRDKKWFMWTHFVQNCHWPYGAPRHFFRMYDKNSKARKIYWKEIEELIKNPESITYSIRQQIERAYASEVLSIDSQIGNIINQLKRRKLLKRTVIIVSADHGELLGEYGYIGHGEFLIDKLIHVPLIIYSPGFGYLEGGKRMSSFVEEVDVAPTILDICGIESKKKFDGKSLVSLLSSNGLPKNLIYSEVIHDKNLPIRDEEFFSACIRTKNFKLIWNSVSNEFSLYNMSIDYEEKENLINKLPKISAEMKRRLVDFLGYSNLNDLKPVRETKVDEDMREKLRALGYIK